jgi:3-methylcrotonyl-CoA carboxylase alpha subunit/geranyl-CoA carboxylase alpha subunit
LSSAKRSSGATDLKAPFNGKVVALAVQAGQAVRRGDTLVVLESMKLEHSLTAPRDAVVAAVTVVVGQQAGPGQMLVRFSE